MLPAFAALVFCVSAVAGDTALIAYGIDSVQEAQFSGNDGRVTPFWHDWDEFDLDAESLTVAGNGISGSLHGFFSSADARMIIRAAYGGRHVYFLARVEDDAFFSDLQDSCRNYEWTAWRADALEWYFDLIPSHRLHAKPGMHFFLSRTRLTKTFTMFQYRIGDTAPSPEYYLTRYNPSWRRSRSISLIGMGGEEDMLMRSRDTLPSKRVEIERLAFNNGTYMVELRISGALIGTGIDRVRDRNIDEIACIFGYNDMDGTCDEGYDRLRWPGEDPWSPSGRWGRMIFGKSLDLIKRQSVLAPPPAQPLDTSITGSYSIFGTTSRYPAIHRRLVAVRTLFSGELWGIHVVPSDVRRVPRATARDTEGGLFPLIASFSPRK